MSGLRVEKLGMLAVLRLDKARGNAIDEPLVEGVIQAMRELSHDESVRGVLLASAHPALFCPGLDLVSLVEYDRDHLRHFMGRFLEMVWTLYGFRKPMVAAINGHAVAGGCILALTTDYRILQRGDAQIGMAEARLGLHLPWSITVLLRSTLPSSALTPVVLLGRSFTGDEALAVGLVDGLADADGFEDFCLARLTELADREPTAYARTKSYLRAPALRAMRSQEEAHAEDFIERWFAPATQGRLRQAIAELTRPRSSGRRPGTISRHQE